ncbi:MAG: histidinol-phosphate transaminase [Kofleriaceae bacterium]
MSERPALPPALAARVSESLRGAAPYHVPVPPGIEVKLDANELPCALPPALAGRLHARLAEVSLHRYPDAGARALRARLAADLGVAPEQLVFGNGSDELIAMLIQAFAAPPPGARAARVLFPSPSFVYYRLACAARGVEPVEVPLAADFTLDEDAVRWAVAEMAPSVALFALPNNPTGTLWPRAFVEQLARDRPELVVVADEAYVDYSGETSLGALAALPNLVVLRTLSKIGLAGLRVGFAIAHPAVAATLEKVRPPYNLGSLSQAAALWFAEEAGPWVRAQAAAVVYERGRLATGLRALPGLEVFASAANLVLVRIGQPGDGRARRVWDHLCAHGILVRIFDGPGPLAGCLRITVGTAAETDRVLAALATAPA